MKPRLNIITLGVNDLQRSRQFYAEGLGFPLLSQSNEHIAFFQLNSIWLALYGREALAEDATVSAEGSDTSAFRGFTLAHNVGSREEVNEVLALAESVGAKLVKPAQEVFWGGYSGYFSDPDGFLWEVAHNPFIEI